MWSLVKVLVPRKSRRCRTRVQQAARASREADDKKGPRAGVTVLSLIVPAFRSRWDDWEETSARAIGEGLDKKNP